MMTSVQRRIWRFFMTRGDDILESLLLTLCTDDEFFTSRVKMARVAVRTKKFVRELPFFFFFSFKAILYLIEYAVPPIAWKFRRFSKLPLEQRLRYLETWENSRIPLKRIVFKLVKAACLCQIMCDHKILVDLGYGKAIQKRVGFKLRGVTDA